MKRVLLALFALTGFSHCASQTGLGRATTLAPGTSQITPSVELSLVSAKFETNQTATVPWVMFGIGYRRGINERVELGLRAWGFGLPQYFTSAGLAADGKFQLFKSVSWHVALAPSLKYHSIVLGDAPWHVVGVEVPLLIGLNLRKHQLIVGIRVNDSLLFGNGTNLINSVWVGSHVAISIRIKRIELIPELGFLWSPVPFNGETKDANRTGASVIHFGIGVAIDSFLQAQNG